MGRTNLQQKRGSGQLQQGAPLLAKTRKKRNKMQKKTLKRKDLRGFILKKFQQNKRLAKFKAKTKEFCELNLQKLSTVLNHQKLCCPICLQIMIEPVITTCGHTFCLPCITKTFKHTKACSICREKLLFQSFNYSTMLKSFIDHFKASKMSLEEIQNHNNRIETFKEQEIVRIVNQNIGIEDLVDYYCKQQWIQGKVIGRNVEEQQLFLIIQPHNREGQVKKYSTQSRFVSKHQYYTNESAFRRPLTQIQIRDFLIPELWNLNRQDRVWQPNSAQYILDDQQFYQLHFS